MRPRLGASSAPKTNELFEHLSALENSGEEVTEFELKKLEREANKLMRADAPAAHALLGTVHSYRWNASAVKHHFENMFKMIGEPYHAAHCYALALLRIGELEEAFLILNKEDWFSGTPDYAVFEDAIHMGTVSGHFREASDRYRQLEEVFPNSPLAKEETNLFRDMSEKLTNREFSENSVRKVIGLAHEIRVKNEVNLQINKPTAVFIDTEAHTVSYALRVFASAYDAAKMNSEIADRVVSQNDLMADPGMKFVVLFVGLN